MDKRLRYLAMAVLLALVVGLFLGANALMKSAVVPGEAAGGATGAAAKTGAAAPRMAIEGDPRMLICRYPGDAASATPEALAALAIDGPLVRTEGETAAYRFTVLRGPGQPAQSIRFSTGPGSRNTAVVSDWAGVAGQAAKQDRFDVAHAPAMTIFGAYSTSSMWGTPRPLMATRLVASAQGVVLEVASDQYTRCVVTRYDDERIYPVAQALSRALMGYLKNTNLSTIVAPERTYGAKTGSKP
jgi:hypothetical protein